MNYSIRFWNLIAERYARQSLPDEATYEKKLATTKTYLRGDMKALEFGCGTGSTALILAPHVSDYQAIDVSPKMIAIAQRKLADTAVDNLRFQQAPLEEYPVADGSLDVVLGHSILHLMHEPDAAVRRVYRMLKPGGIFVTSTACLRDGRRLFRLIAALSQWLPLIPTIKAFTRQELEASLTEAGFVIDYRLVPAHNPIACFLVAIKPEAAQ